MIDIQIKRIIPSGVTQRLHRVYTIPSEWLTLRYRA